MRARAEQPGAMGRELGDPGGHRHDQRGPALPEVPGAAPLAAGLRAAWCVRPQPSRGRPCGDAGNFLCSPCRMRGPARHAHASVSGAPSRHKSHQEEPGVTQQRRRCRTTPRSRPGSSSSLAPGRGARIARRRGSPPPAVQGSQQQISERHARLTRSAVQPCGQAKGAGRWRATTSAPPAQLFAPRLGCCTVRARAQTPSWPSRPRTSTCSAARRRVSPPALALPPARPGAPARSDQPSSALPLPRSREKPRSQRSLLLSRGRHPVRSVRSAG